MWHGEEILVASSPFCAKDISLGSVRPVVGICFSHSTVTWIFFFCMEQQPLLES